MLSSDTYSIFLSFISLPRWFLKTSIRECRSTWIQLSSRVFFAACVCLAPDFVPFPKQRIKKHVDRTKKSRKKIGNKLEYISIQCVVLYDRNSFIVQIQKLNGPYKRFVSILLSRKQSRSDTIESILSGRSSVVYPKCPFFERYGSDRGTYRVQRGMIGSFHRLSEKQFTTNRKRIQPARASSTTQTHSFECIKCSLS